MLIKTCCDCHEQFEVEPAKAWATRCLPCWIALQDKQGKRKVESLQAEVDYWRSRANNGPGDTAELESLKKKYDQAQSEIIRLQLALMSAKNQAPQSSYSSSPIPPEMLRRLIQLAHPDRHGGSEAATKATRWLLGLKRGSR